MAVNERIAFEKWEGYAKPIARGRHVNFGESFRFAPDYVMMSPHFNDGLPQTAAQMFSDEVAAAMAKCAPDGDMLTSEWRMWWKYMPDYRLVSPFECRAGDWGFTSCDTYAGTLADGTVVQLREWDYIWTDDDGRITRWDWFVDPEPWELMLGLVGLEPKGLTSQDYTVTFLREGAL
jgi:hypothetical protein